MLYRASLTFIVALIVGVCILGGLQTPARAFDPSTFNPVTAKEAKVYQRVIELTRSSDSATATKARQILSRQAVKSAPRIGAPLLVAGGLPAVAAGVWTVVGLELYYLPCWECQTVSMTINPNVRPAPGSLTAYGLTQSGELSAVGVVTYSSIRRRSDGDLDSELRFIRAVNSWDVRTFSSTQHRYSASGGSISFARGQGQPSAIGMGNSGYTCPDQSSLGGPCSFPRSVLETKVSSGSSADNKTTWVVRVGTPDGYEWGGNSGTITDAPGSGGSKTYSGPEWGETTEGGSDPNALQLTPTESTAFVNNVVADPETEPLVDPMDVPQQEPDPNWDPNEDPFSPLHDPFSDPEADPDGDGIPNREDPDPEGDEDPDGDGDPNEHPPLAPWPETDDPEQDGDPDGDGDPNETTPATQPDPYDPSASPDADPDDDGIPNEDDPDPAVPTDPGTLPDDHPYSDPDEDGTPNRDDDDDDGDGIPDGDDPNPSTPDDPQILPFWHPYGDPDDDGSPNRIDRDDDNDEQDDWKDDRPWSPMSPDDPGRQDDDGDTVPNRDDPWPGNPYAPYDPDLDKDGDDTPDFEDPAIDDPNVPWSPSGPVENPTFRPEPPNDPDTPWQPDTPWKPGNPGDPNVPMSPDNPNSPRTPQTPDMPIDPSTPNTPYNPTHPNVPDDPTTSDTPDDPGDPGEPPDEGAFCPVNEPYKFDLPEFQLFNVFPFSLVLKAWNIISSLVAAPERPVFDIPMVGPVPIPESADSAISAMRIALSLVLTVGMCFWFWRMITGRGSDNAG